jgi:hypothetical protein
MWRRFYRSDLSELALRVYEIMSIVKTKKNEKEKKDEQELTPTTSPTSFSLPKMGMWSEPFLIFKGFSIHPGLPMNMASFTCIPRSYTCQFKLATWLPFLQIQED